MRRLATPVDSPTLPTSGAGGDDVTPWREIAPRYLFTVACYLLAPYLGLSSRDVDPRIAELWPPGGVGFVLLTVVWYADRRLLLGSLAGMPLVFVSTALLMGEPLGWSVLWALASLAQSVVMAWAYRPLVTRGGWAPEGGRDVCALLAATLGSSLLCGLLGGYPGVAPGEVSHLLLWWVLRNSVFCFVAAATFVVLFHGRGGGALPRNPIWQRALLLLASAVAVYAAYSDPALPLSWLMIVPSVWAGMVLTVRCAAMHSLAVSLLAAAMTYLPHHQFGYTGWLPASSIMDALVMATTFSALLLALLREQRAQLITRLDRQGRDSEQQRAMLATVFETMTDGVMIVGRDGVTMYNQAARVLLGRPVPHQPATSWAETFGATHADGTTLHDDDVRKALFDASGRATNGSLELRVGEGPDARVLRLSARPLVQDPASHTLLLLHDVTTERARVRELQDFAGTVAHDLRGPLTALDGWLEVAQDGRDVPDPHRVDDALERARDAGGRMRQVIEDWLGYTVVRNGQLQHVPVSLEETALEVVAGQSARWSDGDQPHVEIDLPHTVEADPGMLRQLLDNLVGNAIKYTAPGEQPRLRLASWYDDEPFRIRIEVSDRGIGVPEGEEEQIFEEFHRGPTPGRSPGTGLGLALTRRIVALHGGRLTARRNPEGGSTFSFTLPQA